MSVNKLSLAFRHHHFIILFKFTGKFNKFLNLYRNTRATIKVLYTVSLSYCNLHTDQCSNYQFPV